MSASIEVETKKRKKNHDSSDQTARLERTINKLHEERTKIKDYINEINRLENLVNYHDTKAMNAMGLVIKCEETHPHYATLMKMYTDALKEKASTNLTLHLKKDDYEEYQAFLEKEKRMTPRELTYKQDESVSCLGPSASLDDGGGKMPYGYDENPHINNEEDDNDDDNNDDNDDEM